MLFLEKYNLNDAKALLGIDPRDEWTNHARSVILKCYKQYLLALENAIMDGEFSISPDKNRISQEIWDKCKELSDKGFVIGGSVVLNLYGFIERPIGDIDLFLGTDEIEFYVEDHAKVQDRNEEDGYDDEEERVKVNVDGFGIMDVFNQRVDYYVYEGIKLNSPFTALQAKIRYGRNKDINDFISMANMV